MPRLSVGVTTIESAGCNTYLHQKNRHDYVAPMWPTCVRSAGRSMMRHYGSVGSDWLLDNAVEDGNLKG